MSVQASSSRLMRPFQALLTDSAAYRRLGLKTDDMIPDQNPIFNEALRRLSKQEQYDRIWRIRRAFQASISQTELEPSEWIQPSEDTPYLRHLVAQVEREIVEQDAFNNLSEPPQRFLKRNKV